MTTNPEDPTTPTEEPKQTPDPDQPSNEPSEQDTELDFPATTPPLPRS